MIPCGGSHSYASVAAFLRHHKGSPFLSMSVRIMSEVFERSKTQGNARLVLLSLADSCNDDASCWPSVRKIAEKANISEPITKKYLNALIEVGVITRDEREDHFGRQTSNLYAIIVDKIGSDQISRDVIQQVLAPSRIKSVEGVTRVSGGGGNPVQGVGGVTRVSLSIMNHQKEPSKEPSSDFDLDSCVSVVKTRKPRTLKLVDDSFIADLKKLNPTKDVDAQVIIAKNWLLAHPERKFTKPFFSSWISRTKPTITPEQIWKPTTI